MFFMTRKRFEEEVNKRMAEYEDCRFKERQIENMYNRIWKLEERVDRLEGKGPVKAATLEVCNV